MSGCKEGEGTIKFKPCHFICRALKEGVNWEVIMLGGTDVILTDRGVFGQDSYYGEVVIRNNPSMDIITLTIPKGLFSTYLIEIFDIVIRVEGETQLILGNIQREEEVE